MALTVLAPVAAPTTPRVYVEQDFKEFYSMMNYTDFLAHLAAGTLGGKFEISYSDFGA